MLPSEKRIQSKSDYNRFVNHELNNYGLRRKFFFLSYREINILAKHLILLRKTELHNNCNHKLRFYYYKTRLQLLQNKFSLHIPINCCDEGLKIMHVGPVLVNPNAMVGKNCVFHINTGLVAGGVDASSPELGDGVILGIGAVVVGNVRIADDVTIGANSVVTKSVEEEDIAIAGSPARKVSNNGRTKWNKN